MIHEGERLEREAKRREREAEQELDPKRRQQLKWLAADLRQKKRDWERPR